MKLLKCSGSESRGSKLFDLSPLEGMKLTSLDCRLTEVFDLSPLEGMPLTILNCHGTKVTDLSPLKGMPLTDLVIAGLAVTDLSPLAGMKLKTLNFNGCKQVSDISPLRGMPLIRLQFQSSPNVSDLSPLAGMPLRELIALGARISDLSPLEDCKSLTSLFVTGTKVTAAGVAALQKALPKCKIEWDDPAISPQLARGTPPLAGAASDANVLTSPDYVWSEPENLGPKVNSDKDEYDPSVSADGLVLVFASSRSGNGDLFECRRQSTGEPFGEAVALKEVNTISVDGAPFLAADGLTLLFSSTQDRGRAAGKHQGREDIYLAERAGRDAKWGQSVNLGPLVNSAFYDYDPCLSPDGLALYFTSTRPGGVGRYDLWRSRRQSLAAAWEAAESLGPGINTPYDQRFPRLAADGRTLFYRASSGLMLATPTADGGWKTDRLDAPDKDLLGYAFSADGRTLYFASKRAGGLGGADLWLSRRVPKGSGKVSAP